mmetsp:Transcript_117869/g.380407  ORF Transcript_117869/g.380407 Transcript_117869/m.380407 type:complete len:219 (+) Transcript_117869:645-1301(+)
MGGAVQLAPHCQDSIELGLISGAVVPCLAHRAPARDEQHGPGVADVRQPQGTRGGVPQGTNCGGAREEDFDLLLVGLVLEILLHLLEGGSQGKLHRTRLQKISALGLRQEEGERPCRPCGWPVPLWTMPVHDAEDLPVIVQARDAAAVLAKREVALALLALDAQGPDVALGEMRQTAAAAVGLEAQGPDIVGHLTQQAEGVLAGQQGGDLPRSPAATA